MMPTWLCRQDFAEFPMKDHYNGKQSNTAGAVDQGDIGFELLLEKPCRGGAPEGTNSPTATAGSDVVQSGRPIFDDFFQHLWPYIGNNTANVVFQMVKRLWLIRIDQ
ncbi:hypothetical protein TNCV_3778681 [Trichonephila clavipes]|nr:hypothetical protein TNCV_3778681 [Trichonephila clavipes]